ncbi:dihydrosphingosine 1-phosphate phosphatase Ysr3p [Monosporozyma unispora]|nr:hypothetical protein C6P44_004276 [Kazachstania unispora]
MSEIIEVASAMEHDKVKRVGEVKNNTNNILLDPGNHESDHFKSKMHPLRFKLRQYMTRFTDHQSEYLAEWQRKHSTPFRDYFFPYTALMGSHTFYVVFLPMPVWFGYFELTRDLVYILGYSIYLSGFLKDFWCLPRPRSPPVKRSTLSEYTAKEYGAPSSHSANAMGASMYLIYCTWFCSSFSLTSKIFFTGLAFAYYLTLILGRIYCGMHGILDLVSGTICGVICFVSRLGLSYLFRDFKSGEYLWFPLFSVVLGLTLLYKHVRPVDECPCFVDSVAFIGVASGYEIGDWIIQRTGMQLDCTKYTEIGNIIFLRPFIAVPIIIVWKEIISKKLVYTILTKVLRLNDDRAAIIKKRKEVTTEHECTPYIGEPKIEIVGRYLIYAGIPMLTVIAGPLAFRLFGMQ